MTSPVDTTVKHFTSAMAGAPVLNGVVGSLIALLDALLVNGFGTKSVTSLVVSGGVATATYSGGVGAATVGSVIEVSGATPSTLNGEQRVTAITSNTVSFATAQADTTATGTISYKMASLGFIKAFTGTNLAAYRSVAVGSSGFYLRVDDTNAQFGRVIGYESMSDINTGVGPFPTNIQVAGGGYWPKSVSSNTNPISWIFFGDTRAFYLYPPAGTATSADLIIGSLRGFGDMIPLRPSGDAYACALSYVTTNDTSNPNHGAFDSSAQPYIAMPRNYTGLGSALTVFSLPYTGGQLSSVISGNDPTLGPFPSAVDGSLRLSKRFLPILQTNNNTPRADVPGVYSSPQSGLLNTFTNRSIVDGTGPLAGRKLMCVISSNSTSGSTPTPSNSGASFVDITGPWR